MKKCPYCGHENDDKETQCQHCYAGLPQETKRKQKSEKHSDEEK